MSALEARVELARGAARGEPGFRLEAALAAEAGVTAVFGPSGAGKSTLLLALLGGLRPERGRVALGGRPLFDSERGVDLPVHRRRVGIVFQDALLFPHLTALGNVAFALPGGRREEARLALEWVGALELAARRPVELSGGERQRVALARALAARPELLLLDEPFSGLDAAARAALGALVARLAGERGIPFLHVTHDRAEALLLARHAVVLEAGRVVAAGEPARLLGAGGRGDGEEDLVAGTVLGSGEEGTRVDLGGLEVETGDLGCAPGARVVLALRPADVLVARDAVRGTSARNVLPAVVGALAPAGAHVGVGFAPPVPFRAVVTAASARELGLAPGARVHLLVKAHSFRRAG